MKRIIFSLVTIIALAVPCTAQVLTRDGNTFSAPKKERVASAARADSIGAFWEDNDGRYPIYMGAKGGLFYLKEAKSGKHAGELRRHYIPKEQGEEIKRAMGIEPREA